MFRLTVAGAAVALALLLPAGASAKPVVRCGDMTHNGSGIFHVRARAVTCASAHRVARRWLRECGPVTGSCHVGLFKCKTRQVGDEVRATRCGAGHLLVKFRSGS